MPEKNKTEQASSGSEGKERKLFPLKGYIILNLIFWGYCLIQLAVLKYIFRETIGLIFFFIVLGAGFTIVSAFDYIYDRISLKNRTSNENANSEEKRTAQ